MNTVKLEIYSNVEWDSLPCYFVTEVGFYDDLINRAKAIIEASDLTYLGICSITLDCPSSPQEAFLDEDDQPFDIDSCEIRWQGPELVVGKYGSTLWWYSKWSDEKMWADITNT